MFDSLYQYLFSSDVMVVPKKEDEATNVLLRVGDRVSVYSTRFSEWFDDGVIIATFRDSIKVRYGFTRYFGRTLSRGNEKYIYADTMRDVVRPHKITVKSSL